jgi:hypothetical protein
MVTINEIDNTAKSIVFSFENSSEGRDLMEIVINSIVNTHFGRDSNDVHEWIRLNIPPVDNSTITETFKLKPL